MVKSGQQITTMKEDIMLNPSHVNLKKAKRNMKQYYPVHLCFPQSKNDLTLYFDEIEERDTWFNLLQKASKSSLITDFYKLEGEPPESHATM